MPAAPPAPFPAAGGGTDAGASSAWTNLPPLQRTIVDGTPVAPPEAFRSSLTSHQNPSFIASLGHLVDPDGPTGVVGGLAVAAGAPIPYPGAVELRVPDRPAAAPAHTVQRHIGTAWPELASPAESEVARPATRPEDAVGDAAPAADLPAATDLPAREVRAPDEPSPEARTSDPATPALAAPELAASGPSTPGEAAPAPSTPGEAAPSPSTPDPDRTHPLVSGPPSATADVAAGPPTRPDTAELAVARSAADSPEATPPRSPHRSTTEDLVVARSVADPPTGARSDAPIHGHTPDLVAPRSVADTAAGPPPDPPTSPQGVDIVVARSLADTPEQARPSPPRSSTAAEAARPDPPNPPAAAELVVARSAADPAGDAVDGVSDETPSGAPHPGWEAEPGFTPPAPSASSEPDPSAEPSHVEPAGEVAGLLTERPLLAEPRMEAATTPGSAGTAIDASDARAPQVVSPLPGAAPAPAQQAGSTPAVQRLPVDPSTPRSAAGIASGLPSAVAAGLSGAVALPGPVTDESGYPPLVARRVQRSAAEAGATRPATAAQDFGAAPGEQGASSRSLSGFAAAITTVTAHPERAIGSVGPDFSEPASDDVAEPELGGHTAIGQASPGRARRDLVVARHVAPDAEGRLPEAQVRLSATPVTGGAGHTVQRSVLADRPGLLPTGAEPSPTATAGAATPPVQRVRYEALATERTAEQHAPAEGSSGGREPWLQVPGSDPDRLVLSDVAAASIPHHDSGGPAPIQRAVARRESSAPVAWPTASARSTAPQSPVQVPLSVQPASLSPVGSDGPAHVRSAGSLDPHKAAWTPSVQRSFGPGTSPEPGPGSAAAPAEAAGMAVSGRSVGLAELFAMAAAQGPVEDPPVQRHAVEPETRVELPVQTAPAERSSSAPPAPTAKAGPPGGAELEELARRLYEPLSSRLRTELWTDRERAGLLTDLRP